MSRCEWIVCERTDRWAAALRVTIAGQADWPACTPRLYEVRSLEELGARLELRPDCLVLINVDEANLSRVLPWLAAARGNYSGVRFVALIDHDFDSCGQDVADAILEAGAADFATSPRHLPQILPLARRHAAAIAARQSAAASDDSFVASVWFSLPWQADEREVP